VIQRGPKSAASKQAVVVEGTFNRRPEPLDDLTQRQAVIWRETVASEPVEFFNSAALRGLLSDYCRHREAAENVSAIIDKFNPEWLKNGDAVKRYEYLLRIRESETRAAAAMARALKLTNQWRYTPMAAATMAPSAPKRPRGRQTVYSQQVAEEVCDRLAAGESLISISTDPRMPPRSTVIEWVEDNREGFAEQYMRARSRGYERMAEELVAISDADCTFAGQPDPALVQQARLRVDTRKWMLSKMLPKKYGDRVVQELVGDGDRPIVSRIELVPIAPRRALPGPEDAD